MADNAVPAVAEKKRTKLIRYRGVLTNWCGVALDRSILSHIRVGNIVRIVVSSYESNNAQGAYYYEIIRHCKKDPRCFVGRLSDPYIDLTWAPINADDEQTFPVDYIMEIPLTWPGNENLNRNAKFFDRQRGITGIMF
jgi:hypothetical protein